MAQAKKKRSRKRRGTQAGSVGKARRSRPRSRAEARAQARSKPAAKKGSRQDRPPTWRSATVRGVLAALVFVALLLFMLGRPVGEALAFGAFMFVLYIPAGYYMDLALWRRRERARIRAGK